MEIGKIWCDLQCFFFDENVKTWDPKTGNLLATMEGHFRSIRCLAISEKEGAIFSGSGDNKIKKWDLKTGNLLATMEGHSDSITRLAISEKEGAIFRGLSWTKKSRNGI